MLACCLILVLAVAAQAATVLVTGANRGLGLATATLLLEQGHAVVATSRGSIDALKHLAQLSNPATAERTWLWQLDVAQPDSVAQLGSELLPLLGPIDAVINNAGACLVGSDVDTLRRTLDVNFYGTVNVWEACLPFMRPQGCVINVTSGDGELLCLSSSIAAELFSAETLQVRQNSK
jgi:NAD(P)-dependent dehydrogenase (short-subunit alcohol dehydrogenase family)